MNWHKDLAMASSPSLVIDLVNEYLALVPVDARIPVALRPEQVNTPADIEYWHHKLSDAVPNLSRPNLALQDLCVVFVRAAARLAQLSREDPANSDAKAANA